LYNCILWDGDNEIGRNDASTINIFYSNLQGEWPGIGNIDQDPMFIYSPLYGLDGNYFYLKTNSSLQPDVLLKADFVKWYVLVK